MNQRQSFSQGSDMSQNQRQSAQIWDAHGSKQQINITSTPHALVGASITVSTEVLVPVLKEVHATNAVAAVISGVVLGHMYGYVTGVIGMIRQHQCRAKLSCLVL